MSHWLRQLLALWLLLTVAWSGIAHAEPQAILEEKIREKLDRMFTSDQYMIDIQPGAALPMNSTPRIDSLLPGLELLGSPGSLRGDLLLIVDKSVSKERVKVAEDIVKRIIKGERLDKNIRIAVRQQDIIKVPPKAPELPATPPEPSFFDHLNANKDLVMRGLLVLWGAIISLMAAHFALKRILGQIGGQSLADQSGPGRQKAASSNQERVSPGEAASPDTPSMRKLAASKDELYSKDQALLNSIQEVVGEAKTAPRKVAKIFTRWVSQSEENAHFAGVFLKNCDIKTIESICSLLHPSDLEKILSFKVHDFDPFSDENQRVLDRMRADMAYLAAEQLLKEKPDPLEFMRILSDDDISLVLQGEELETLALVATQIPAHRLTKFYGSLDPRVLNDILALIAKIHSPTIENFHAVRDRLQKKTATLSISLFSDKTRKQTISHLIDTVTNPSTQLNLLERLRAENKALYASVRAQTFTATDLNHLSSRALTVLIQTLDPSVFATALGGIGANFEKFTGHLPDAYRTILTDGMQREVDEETRDQAWRRVKSTIKEMISSGMMAQSEVAAAISIAEEDRESDRSTATAAIDESLPYAS